MMKCTANIVGLIAVAGLAFAIGHYGPLSGTDSAAYAAPQDRDEHEGHDHGQQMPPEMAKRFEAMNKAMQPGENHKVLDMLIGEWEGTFKMWMDPNMPPMEMPGTVTREWVLDGHYVRERVESPSPQGTFLGLGYLGYNNIDGQFETIWMENMATKIMFAAATYDPDKKVMTFYGTDRDPLTGHVLHSRGTLDMSNPNRQSYVGYKTGPDGREYKEFEGTMERKR